MGGGRGLDVLDFRGELIVIDPCRMTGVGGRPEVIIEGSNHMDHGWMEYNFLYKPGNITERPPRVGMQHFTNLVRH